LTILAKKSLSSEFSKAKNQREKNKYTLGMPWIVHNFSSHKKSHYLALGYKENLADIRHKRSIICKHSQSMYNKLRYQAKIHTISAKLLKKKNMLQWLRNKTTPSMRGKIKPVFKEK